jgi:hypothetical protein
MGEGDLVTLANLRAQTSKDLAKLARNEGVQGWHSMRKEQLIQAILKLSRRRSNGTPPRSGKSGPPNGQASNGTNGQSRIENTRNEIQRQSAVAAQIERENRRAEELKNLALDSSLKKNAIKPVKDRVILIVRDAFWLQVYWEITPATVARAKTALEKHWRGARPILRLLEIPRDGNPTDERVERDIPIHGGVSHWYIDTQTPQKRWRVAIGYLSPSGRFFTISRSNMVTTPADNSGADDAHWADVATNCESVFAVSGGYDPDSETTDLREIFEEKMHRPMASLGPHHMHLIDDADSFKFEVDAQMVIYGAAAPGSSVSIGGEPLEVAADGTFSTRVELPDRRQVLPVVACSRDGTQQRTTVLAVERNTKVMEAVTNDMEDM